MSIADRLANLSREQRALLFEQIRQRKEKERAAAPGHIPRRPPGPGPLPLSFAQERLWFIDRLQPGLSVYNMPLALRIAGETSPGVHGAILGEVVRRHESLRTTFHEEAGRPVQAVSPPGEWTLPLVDLSALPAGRRLEVARRLAQEEADRPFDLRRGPLLRAVLLRLAPAEHALLLDMHHIVSDGWSMGVLVREITGLYAAWTAGRPSPLPELPVQYPDFAVWQRGWLAGGVLDAQLSYWRRQLAGAPTSLPLPLDRPRPATPSHRGSRVSVLLPPSLARDLAQLARRRDATLYMVLLAALQALLSRLTGEEDVPVGSPIANRNRAEIEGLIGFFVNTLVLRGDLAGAPAFHELLARTRRTTLEAYSHQDVPFEQVVEDLHPERHLAVNPLFQVMYALQNAPVGDLDLPGLSFSPLEFARVTAQFDLELNVVEAGGSLKMEFAYGSDLFDAATVLRIAGHLESLLSAVAVDDGLRLPDLPLLSAGERHQLRAEWNDTARVTEPRSAPERFAARVAATPDALALEAGEERLSYAELDRRAGGIAIRLREAGVGPGVVVGLFAERSAEMAAGLLAVWKAGGAWLPLDPGLPAARLAWMLEDSGAPVVAVGAGLAGALPETTARMVPLDGADPADPGETFGQEPRPGDLAYLIYTSGTTGRPKAVQVEHGNLASTLDAVQEAFGFGPGDRMPAIASFSFDIFLFELLGPLLAGGTSVLLPLRPSLDFERLAAELERATLLHAVPAVMRQVAVLARRRSAPTTLRGLFTGGDAVPADLLEDLREVFPGAAIHVLYGPTETAIVCTHWRVPSAGPVRTLLGRPFAGVEIELRDAAGHPVPVGVTGEIWIGGAGVTRGYLGRPELTAEKFVEREGRRYFRSGDLARQMPDGTLEFLGRADEQVKVRGFRVEPGEVEAALLRQPGVEAAVVDAREVTPGAGRQLVAWVVPRAEALPPEEAAEQVSQWRALYDETYGRSAPADPTFDVEGWNSSYTGEPIPEVEMREWVDSTVGRILSLRPRRVLEVGCGTGLVLFRVAPHTELYRGTDFSQVVLEKLRRRIAEAGLELPQVELAQATADDWGGVAPGSFDLVVLNSVVQYFPDAGYLLRVLEGAVRAARPGGAIWIGDVRNLDLLESLHASVELFRAADTDTAAELRRRVRRKVADEEELLLSPAFFAGLPGHLPGIGGAEVLPKPGRRNELTRFRYDVLLHVGPGPGTLAGLEEIERRAAAERAELALLAAAEDGDTAGELRKAPLPVPAVSDVPSRPHANDPLRGRLARRLAPELRRLLAAELPDYMVPAWFTFLDALPLTPHGKVDRAALPEPDVQRAAAGEPPRTPAEETMAELWRPLLGLDRIGRDDDFFELGGHSLLATQLVSRVRETFGVDLPLRRVFESPTLSGLAAAVESLGAGASSPGAIPRRPPGLDPLPASFGQERLWFLDRLRPGDPAHNLSDALRIEGEAPPPLLAAILGEVARRHESLRTTFKERQGRPVQVVAPPAGPWAPALADLSGLPAERRLDEARRLAAAESARPYDLGRGPLLRATLLRLAPRDHVLLLALHHIVSDGWSMGVLVREITALHAAALSGRPSPLPELAVQYADFALWQRAWLTGEELDRQLDYWRRRLAGAPAVLDLPADRPRPAAPSHHGSRALVPLDAGLSGELKRLASRREATLFMVVLATFQALLARLSGQTDVLVGSPVANRNRSEIEPLIGFFVNTLVLRGDLSGDPPFGELLARARNAALEDFAHQDLPFESLVEELRPRRDLAVTPLFQVMCALQNAVTAPARLPGLSFSRLELEAAVVQYELELNVWPNGESLLASFSYSTDRFDPATVWRLAGAFETLLRGILAGEERRLAELPLLSPGERHQLLAEWNDTGRPREPRGVVERFAEQVARSPQAPALEAGEERLSYAALDHRSARIARRLRGLGVGPGTVVGLFAGRAAEMVAGLLGIWKAGGAFLPLDPGLPAARVAWMLEDSEAPVVLAGAGLAEGLPARGARVLPLDAGDPEGGPEGGPPPAGLPSPGDLAYLIYTSGTTGRPKAVQVEHGQLAGTLGAVQEAFGFGPGDRMPAIASFSFDIFLFELLGPLLAGGTSVLLPLRPALDLERLARELEGATLLHAVPAVMRQVADLARRRSAPTALRALFTGGDAVPADLLADLREIFPGAAVWELYGPTEAAIVCAAWRVPPEGSVRSLLGRPLAGVEIDLRDASGHPVPVGVAGEIWIGGSGVARGYRGRPELTAEKFVEAGGRRFFRSGDLARRLPDGNLEFLGRADQQVKVRGFRVEPGEVEAALLRQPGVEAAVVTARETAPGGDLRLVAHLVARAPAADLRRALRAELPDFMVPSRFVFLDALPLTAHGKVDRAALPDPPELQEEDGSLGGPPVTPAEQTLAALWRELLGSGPVGREDDFFELGGHSLLATRLVSRVREAFGVELPLQQVFETPALAPLAAWIERLERAARPVPAPVAPAARADRLAGLSREQKALAFERLRAQRGARAAGAARIPRRPAGPGPVPASFAQERLWFLDRLYPGSAAYSIPDALSIRGEASQPLLEGILREVVRRHEALRTTFEERGGRPVQVVAPPGPWELPLVDLAGLPEERRAGEARRLALASADRPFDLGRGPLLRATLLRLGPVDHALLLAMHHIVSDGWSMGVLVNEVTALYGAALAGLPSPLPELAVQYPDFAVWQREWLRDDVLEAQLSYWRQRLAGAPPLELPTDRPRPAVSSYRGGRVSHPFPAGFGRELSRFARSADATPFMVLLAGFQILLGRAAGQDDLAVGTPIANRNRAEIEPLIGLFVNTLVLRADLRGDPDFSGLLARARQATLEAYTHQDLPFDQLVQELRPERRLSASPLFQVLCALQNAPAGRADLPGLTLERMDLPADATRFDLELHGWEGEEELLTHLFYSTDLFDAATILRLAGHLEVLLLAALADPGRRLSDLPLLAPAERHQAVVEWNDTAAGYPSTASIPELFAAQAAARPGAVAVEQGDRRLTYGELRERAWRLARRLVAAGIRPEERVAVLAERSPDLVVAQLGILRAGGAYLPLDTAYPPERLAWMAADAGASMLVAAAEPDPGLKLPEELRLILLEDGPEDDGPAADLPEVPAGFLAYVMYTSGSTGRPKGVAVTHRNVVRLVRGADYAGMGPDEVWLQYAPVAFDVSTLEIWAPLLNGGRVALFPGRIGSLEELARTIARHGVTSAWLTAGLFHEMVDGNLEGLRPLRQLLSGGDVVSAEHARRALAAHPGLVLIDGYGPTENTTFTSCQRLTDPGQVGESVPIGRPVSNSRVYVLDRHLQPAPAGIWGELFAGGDGVARGYLDRPELTAERFLPDPWSAEPGARLYRTGDRVRLRPDGALEFQGRLDTQVKIRGFRIEPGEIEAALLACPGVLRAAVTAVGEAGRKSLAAYWVGEAGEEELRAALRARLPEPLIPSFFVPLADLPLTPNGKLDRAALPVPGRRGAGSGGPPRTPAEEAMAALWREVLAGGAVEGIGRDDDFFALGGHSLLATQLVSRVRSAFGVELPLRRVFEHPTLAALAAAVEILGSGPGAGLAAPLPRRPAGLDPVPASFSQERLWLMDRLRPGNPAYNIPDALRIGGKVSPVLLAGILGEVVRRHEALRTTFEERGGRPAQVIAPPGRWELPLVDLAELPAEAGLAAAGRLASEESARPFDLRRGPLLRASLLRLGPRDHVLLLTLHHIVSDGWSMGVLVGEITALYGAALAGRPSPLPELAVQYADYAVWQRAWLTEGELERQLDYWRRRLDGVPASIDLPADRPRPAVPSYRGARTLLRLDPGLAAALKRLALESEATLFMVVLAGFQALLGRLAGQEDFATGSPIANLGRVEIEPLIGFFVNTLVLRADLAGDPPFRELLARVRRTTLEAYAHQDLPFETLVERLRPQRHLAVNPLFQVMCAVQNAPFGGLDLSGLSFFRLTVETLTAQFDFELNVWEVEDSLLAVFTYSTDLFDAATARRMAGQLETLLWAAAGGNPRLAVLPLLAPGERHQLLVEWNDTGRGREPRSAPERFAARVATTPDAPALEAGEERLSYAELDRRAGGIAIRLREAGVGPGVVVGLFAERSAEMVAGLLAVWKAGGAWLPLDPGLPAARLAWMLEDSGAPVVAVGAGLAGALPETTARVVPLDGADPADPGETFGQEPRPGDLAYLIYTSGTTGRPKAVQVEHGNLASTLDAVQEAFGFGPGDRMPAIASFSFDIFLFELLGPLLAGGTSVLLPLRPSLDFERLAAELERATLLHAVPAVMRQVAVLARRRSAPTTLRGLFTGGDAVPADLLEDLREVFPGAAIHVLYGPTETAIVCTHWRVPSAGPVRTLLGRPFAGVEIELRDAAGHPVPVGVTGEIWIGGAGVTRGYLGRPELTAEKFVEREGRRYFRSGDLARQMPDGTLEFLGRADEQVKVRGFRVEPGEVEAALLRQPGVEAAVVDAREVTPGAGRQLVAWVVPRAEALPPEEAAEQVSQWRALYDETYGRSAPADPTFDVEGWNSSYTGEPIPEAEMREWVDSTVGRILSLRPRRVLEVGCGTGLVLFRVAPHTELYRGTDFSQVVLEKLRRRIAEAGLELPQVELAQAIADDWGGVAPGSFDLVVLNSVVQYFPDAGYLLRVLEGAVRAARPGGAIWIGDVRNLDLLESLHASVELFRAADTDTAAELRRRVRRKVADEEELLLSPAFFAGLPGHLPGIGGAEVLPKPGSRNELTRFRYDVLLHVGPGPGTLAGLEEIERRAAAERAELALLAAAEDGDTAGELRKAPLPVPAVSDVPSRPHANDPLRGRLARRLAPELRRALAAELPDYMVPAWFTFLDALPLTPHGKVDRSALPEPDVQRGGAGGEPPRTPAEEAVAGLWRDLLGVEGIGREDDFFALGGHSLLATQLVSRLREASGVEVPLRAVFEAPTVAALAARIEPALAAAAAPAAAPPEAPLPEPDRLAGLSPERRARVFEVVRKRRERLASAPPNRIPRRPPGLDPVPASFAQERLWFLDRLEPGNTAFNMGSSLRLRGRLDAGTLERALDETVRRHESLRTTFVETDGRPAQRIVPRLRVPLRRIDLSALPGEAREAEAERIARASLAAPFDLATGPLLRASLLRLAPDLHAFVLEIHHIVTDGWSAGVMGRELILLYEAFAAGLPSPLPELPLQYGDFALWQREWLSGETLEAQLSYWREKLGGELAPLDLPTDRPRPPVQTFRGGDRRLDLPEPVAAALRRLSRERGGSLFMVLLAAFKALLSRLSGQDDVIVGSPIAGRRHSGTEELIGFFLNTLALRTSVAGNPAFRELLERVRETTLGAFTHQDIPFEALLAELRPERDLSRTPVFQVFFNLLNLPSAGGHLPALEVEPGPAPEPESKFDLTFYVAEAGEGIHFNLVYNADLFDAVRMEELLRQYRQVLEAVARDPGHRVEDLPLVTPEAARLLPDPSRRLPAGWPGAVHQRFVERARRHPARPAAIDLQGAWTWGDLDAASGRLAARLLAAGAGADGPVAVWAHRAAPLAAALLGALRAGAPFVILDPAYPPARLAAVVEKARPRAWVAVPGAPPVSIDLSPIPGFEVEGPGLAPDTGAPCAEVHPDAPAWIAFTSGSTGEPKGIVGSHRPLSHFLDWHAGTFRLGEDDRFSLLSGLAHDPLLRDVFTPLWVGGELRVPAPEGMGEPGWLAGWFARERITVSHLTPAMARLLATGEEPLGDLRLVCSGGEALAGEDVARLRRIAPRALLVNFYGATETPQAMGWKVVEETVPRASRIPLGRGIEGVDLLVLGRSGRPAGLGELGEISIRTPYLALGYLADPVATADRFVPATEGGRLYRTGDLGRYALDGEVTWTGRADRQVKIRGFRVEPGEAEAAIARLDEVREVLVLPRTEGGETYLAAWVVPAPGAAPDLAGRLRGLLAATLPAYLVPAAFVELPALPLTPNGKVDRRALPALGRPEGEIEAPRTPEEEALAGLWAELLRVERIGVRDNFFELGGHSLLATQLVSRVRSSLGVEVSLRQLFENPTLEGLAGVIASQGGPRGEAIPRRPPGLDPIPASFAQERMWLLDRLEPGNPAYNIPYALRLLGELPVPLMTAAFGEVARRHESLRTTFADRGGQPAQVVAPPLPPGAWPLPLADLSALPEGARLAEASRLAGEEAGRPFDLGRGPLLRTVLVRLGAADHGLFLTLHHSIADGWSVGVLIHEISALFEAAFHGRPSPLPPLPIQYPDFAVWQRGWLTGAELERQLDYWRRRLDGAPASLDLPLDRPRPAVPTYQGSRAALRLHPELAADLRRFALRHGATLFMVFLAGFQALLRRLTGQEDFSVGSPIANRNRAEIEPLIGFFVNTLVLRADLTGDPSFRELAARARHATLEAYAHQDLPFELLVEELRPERHLAVNPLFQVMYAVQNTPREGVDLPGLSLAPLDTEMTTARFDFELNVWEAGGALDLLFIYSTELFDPATVLRVAGSLETLLRGALADDGTRLSGLPLLPEAARHQLLAEWNDTGRGETPRTAPERFSAQAAATPDALAVEAGGRRLTYADLDRLSGRLAGRLRRLGVGPETVVGLFADRAPEMAAGILAVWKAGGAYLPLSPGLPQARLAYMLEDSGVSVIATTADLAGELPPHGARLLFLEEPGDEDGETLDGQARPGDLAYRIYTSGTTGQPKAVQVEHGQLASTLAAVQEAFGFGPGDRMPCIASFSFDIFLFELLGPLLAGGTCVLLPLRPTLDFERLAQELETATLLHAVPAVMRQVVDLARRRNAPTALRALFTGGDAVPSDLLEDLRETFPAAEVHVLYGPTETAIVCTSWRVPDEGPVRTLLGRPFAGAEIELRDSFANPVPIGVPGEIWIGGSGVTRGYWRRPELTAEKFVELDGRRYFRSGDQARQLPDGTLEFLGRADQQVKVRGFRIELGEVEAALLSRPGLAEAVVTARELTPGAGRQLVAYVVPAADAAVAPPEEAAEHVSQWRTLYDETYGRSAPADPTFDVEGWNSSYTGEPIPMGEMREWVDATVERILSLRPRRVLEVGCGTGLLLFRVAPRTDLYRAADFSPVVLGKLRRRIAEADLDLPQVELAQATADDWSGVAPGSFDLVILNSVVQYFPDVDYLLRVLEGAARAVRPGGSIWIGDVRNLDLLEALHASVELFRAADSDTAADLRRRVRRKVADEEELLLAPAFFPALVGHLPGVSRAEVLPKRESHPNELTRFRYDAILHVGGAPGETSLAGIQRKTAEESAVLALLAAAEDGDTAGELRQAAVPAVSAVPAPSASSPLPWSVYANNPLRGKLARRLGPALRRALAAELPDYMVPAVYVVLDSLPLTAHGKVDRAALPEPETARPSAATAPPRTPVERALADLWREVLGVGEVGREDGFFELGGHSLLATQLVSRVREAFGVEVPLRVLFEAPTVAGLAAWLEGAPASPAAPLAPPIRPVPRDRPIPLSFAQERLWFLDRLWPGDRAYNMLAALRLQGELSPEILEAVLREVVRRHESLRTTFELREGWPEQAVAPPEPPGHWTLPRIDLSGLPEGRALETAARLAREESVRPFDLERGPVLRAALLRLGPAGHALLLSMHHIVSDGWSMGVLTREITALYAAALSGRPSPLPELAVQYPDFAVWQREWLAGEELERQLAYWRERLAGVPAALDLPADRPRPAVPSHRGGRLTLPWEPDFARALNRFALRRESTLFMVLLAGFQALLGHLTGQEDVPVGTLIANRNRAEIEPLIGFFVNTLVLRGDLSGNPTFRELLERTRRATLEDFAHQDLPFERLVEALRLPRTPAANPLVQATFVLQNAPGGGGELPGLEVAPLEVERTTTRFDLELGVWETGDSLALEFIYNADLFDPATIRRIGISLETLLRGVLEDDGRPLAALLAPLPAPARRQFLAGEIPAPPVEEPAGPGDPPRTPLERLLARHFREVLDLPEGREIGVDEDFFALGGASIAAAVLARRLQEALATEVPVLAIFGHPTVASLAGYLEETAGPDRAVSDMT